ncbi:50S ribosomal protein L11 methyltransferase [Frigidibacter oleivorans]|uniref:50S ribosomal protein L11 methyltransferase n=1 Tax=Frigidibacter oleivorans TaxID=2487129 RepID=UPI000F8F77F3|nr:50S ribosomal protein L11 methyltransferase [Frigidibacter oleivorans]
MTTFTALTTLAGRDPAEALGEAMEAMEPEPTGVGVFEIEDGSGRWEVGGYFLDRPDDTELALLAAAFGAQPFIVSEVPDTDWVAHVRRDLHPIEAGRFFIYGAHDADKVPEGREPLLIEAAMAFGTGHHGTTQGCLIALDRLDAEGVRAAKVADIGCGTAVLAMAAARIWPEIAPVMASDLDIVAVDTAAANVVANGLAGRVECFECAGFDHDRHDAAAPYDLVFANILKGPLIELAPEMGRRIAPAGHAILSGILTVQADETEAAYREAGFATHARDEIGEWTTLVMRRIQ